MIMVVGRATVPYWRGAKRVRRSGRNQNKTGREMRLKKLKKGQAVDLFPGCATCVHHHGLERTERNMADFGAE